MRPFRPASPAFATLRSVPVAIAVATWVLLLAPAAEARREKPAATPATVASAYPDELFASLAWREVGPYRGGRSAAVAGIPGQPLVYYFGATGGGVWKTTDAGTTWANVSDGFFGGSIGAVAVATADPNVVYVGGGEKTVRGNVSHGDGVWKSTDAGATWKHVGLADSRHVPRIRVDPRDPDRVFAAVLGHLYGPNAERGVFRSSDGGATWERVLFVDERSGAIDLAMDPTNPRVLYASFWQVLRTPWSLESGGPGSGLWKSTDGGTSWDELTGNDGFPDRPWGISGVDVSASDPRSVYAIVEAEDGGVFRSTDGGETWERTNDSRDLRQRAWYYTRIYADPQDADTVYVPNVRFHRSKDGGKTFTQIPTPHGDNHDLWIAPEDPRRMIEANDGGVNVSFDGGETWSPQDNQPTAQMYRVSTDDAFPYRLLGGQQDNSALRIRSRSFTGNRITARDWEPTAGGESGHVVAQPGDPDVVYGGSYGGYLTRVDHATGEVRAVNVWPDDPMGWGAAELRYRFQWNYPIFFSPHDPETLYAAANVLFRSRDGGATWQPISPDLTRDDKTKQGPSGGPITKDNTSVEYYATIFAAAESPLRPGVLWTGSDDGLVHLSTDAGGTWQDVTPPAMPEWAQVNAIDPHPTEPGGLYVAATRYKLDDFRPYLYRTTDWGATWTEITAGIPADHFTRVVRADTARPGLLYAGTERGVHVSFDDGGAWRPLQLELPIVPITDLAVKDGDLVAATQGRGYWILDDLAVLREMAPDVTTDPLHLFTPEPAYRLRGGHEEDPHLAGENPPDGVVFHFWLAAEPAADQTVELTLLEDDGDVVRTFTRKPDEDEDDEGEGKDEKPKDDDFHGDDPRQLEVEKGMNRFVWDLGYPSAERFPDMILWNDDLAGPRALPGTYRARLTIGDATAETTFTVLADPRSTATPEDRRAQFDFAQSIVDVLTDVHQSIRHLRDTRAALGDLVDRLEDDQSAPEVVTAAKSLREELGEVEKALYQTQSKSRQDPLNYPIRLNDKLAAVLGLATYGDFAPTESMVAVRDELVTAIEAELATLQVLLDERVAEVNRLARSAGVAILSAPSGN